METDGSDDDHDPQRRALARLVLAGSLVGVGVPAAACAPGGALPPLPTGRTHTLPSTTRTVSAGVLDPSRPVAVTIRSGDVVHYPDTWLHWGNKPRFGMTFAEREPLRKQYPDGPYSIVGPVAVDGAEPGDVIECRIVRIRPIDWGWNSSPLGVGALPDTFKQPYLHYFRFDADRASSEFAPGVRIPLRPFQAVMAVQPEGDARVSGLLTGPYGGCLVIPELTEGSSLFLPVQVPGARIWTSDTHASQGDGFVNDTGIETACEDLRIQYVLHKGRTIPGPLGETPTHFIALGYADNLDDALVMALKRTIGWLSPASGLSEADIYAIASISGSFRVTQYAHTVHSNYTAETAKAVHGMIPKALFAEALAQRMSDWLRGGRRKG